MGRRAYTAVKKPQQEETPMPVYYSRVIFKTGSDPQRRLILMDVLAQYRRAVTLYPKFLVSPGDSLSLLDIQRQSCLRRLPLDLAQTKETPDIQKIIERSDEVVVVVRNQFSSFWFTALANAICRNIGPTRKMQVKVCYASGFTKSGMPRPKGKKKENKYANRPKRLRK